jgi:hypothetical protein
MNTRFSFSSGYPPLSKIDFQEIPLAGGQITNEHRRSQIWSPVAELINQKITYETRITYETIFYRLDSHSHDFEFCFRSNKKQAK